MHTQESKRGRREGGKMIQWRSTVTSTVVPWARKRRKERHSHGEEKGEGFALRL